MSETLPQFPQAAQCDEIDVISSSSDDGVELATCLDNVEIVDAPSDSVSDSPQDQADNPDDQLDDQKWAVVPDDKRVTAMTGASASLEEMRNPCVEGHRSTR